MKTNIPSEAQIEQLLAQANSKYQLIILLMLDAGLRVSEVVSLQIQDFDLSGRIVNVPFKLTEQEDSLVTVNLKSLLLSSARSFLFNQLLSKRIEKFAWNHLFSGEVMILTGSGSNFSLRI